MDKAIFYCSTRGATSALALNSTDNRLIAAGQQSTNERTKKIFFLFGFVKIDFQLFSIEQNDNTEKFIEIRDFRNTPPRQSTVSRWCALQPKDVAWNPNDG
jgi:hypothetical protein